VFQVEDRGLIFDAGRQPPQRRIAFFTALCPLASGTILCSFQIGPGKHAPTSTLGLCRSTDRRTWQPIPVEVGTSIGGVPGSIGAAELVEVRPGKLLLAATWFDRSEPHRPLFDPVTEGILHSKTLLAISLDEGASWGPWRELDTGELTGCALTGPPLLWSDGTLGIPLESFKEFDDAWPGRHAAWLLVSQDGGESFDPPQLVAQHPNHELYYWDQRLCPLPEPGSYVAMFWTHDLRQRRDRHVHLLRGRVGVPASGQPVETSIPGQIAAPLALDDGELLALVVDRGEPGTITLWKSHDGGCAWPEQDRLVLYTHQEKARLSQGKTDVDFKQYWEDMGKWSFGHPALRRLSDGRLLAAWYAGTPDCMSLHWARLALKD
jgi:hypothetical protein